MKTLFVIMASMLTVSLANAQKLKEADVPAAVKNAFSKEFPGSKAKEWAKEGDSYEAEFDLKKVETCAVFNTSGKLMETEQEIKTSELPKAVSEYVTKNYAGYKITEGSKITEAGGTGVVTYEAEIQKGKEEIDLIFDEKGAFLKKEGADANDDKDEK